MKEPLEHDDLIGANTYVVLRGDDGGFVYLVSPVALVRCDQDVLQDVLKMLDAEMNDDLIGASIAFEEPASDGSIWGGSGGGVATGAVWVHSAIPQDVCEMAIRKLTGSD